MAVLVGLSSVLDSMLKYFNANYQFDASFKARLQYNVLDTTKDSICIGIEDGSYKEVAIDCTSDYKRCTCNIQLVYRVKSSQTGGSDLKCISLVDDMMEFIISNYKQLVADNIYMDNMRVVASANLLTAYQSGEKDFSSTFSITFER